MSAIARYSVCLLLRSPFMFQGLANSRRGVDSAFLRDERGRPVIPADQLKGVLRSACYLLTTEAKGVPASTLFAKLFGGRSPDDSHDEPNRGLLIFSDLHADIDNASTTTTRIEIDDETGAAKTGALQVVELAAPFGKEVEFSGDIYLLAKGVVEPQAVETLLKRAISLVPSIGAFKSAGFGEVVGARVTMEEPTPVVLAAGGEASGGKTLERLAYRVTFDQPILVDATRETDNLFVGASVVPGAVFKGALAAKLQLAGVEHPEHDAEWSKPLAALRISHAFPENDDGELSGFAVPHSLCAWKEGENFCFEDALRREGDDVCGVVKQDGGKWRAPTHPIDWKDEVFEALSKKGLLPKRPWIAPQPRTHVRIDGESLVGVDGALFTTVAQGVLCKGDARCWRVVVDFTCVPKERRAQLRQLIEGGLIPIGRTGAVATFKAITTDDPPKDAGGLGRLRLDTAAEPLAIKGKLYDKDALYALTLVTPALLTDPRLNPQSKTTIEDQYVNHIEAQTGGTLVRSYTSRRLAGGYIATRRQPYGKDIYYPFVLTEPGSVFLVKGGDKDKLERIARFGLAPVELIKPKRLTWENCPYLPENGYGEVVFSLVDHATLKRPAHG